MPLTSIEIYNALRDVPHHKIIGYLSLLFDHYKNNGLPKEDIERAGEAIEILTQLPQRFPRQLRECHTLRELACSARHPFALFMANVTKFYHTKVPADLAALTTR